MDSFKTITDFDVNGRRVRMSSLPALERAGFPAVARLPFSLKILLENLLRHEDGALREDGRHRGAGHLGPGRRPREGNRVHAGARAAAGLHRRARVVDLAAMRDAMARLGGDPNKVNPLQPVELVIDHSVQVDHFGTADAFHAERRPRVRAQPRALHVPALGPERVLELPRRAARDRHRPPGEPRVPGARRVRASRRTA